MAPPTGAVIPPAGAMARPSGAVAAPMGAVTQPTGDSIFRLSQEDGMRYLDKLATYGRFKSAILEEVSRQIGDASHGKDSEDR
jgi:hypothetical protein